MGYNRKDYYFTKAKKEGFAARSVFKLEEIDARFKLIRPSDKVLDLGAAPGSWSQYIAKKIGPKGRLLGIDLQPIRLTFPNAVFIAADMLMADLPALLSEFKFEPPFDVVVSDMAPKTTGVRVTDQARSLELCELALRVAGRYLKAGGHFVCKLFHGEEFEAFRALLKSQFETVEVLRPKSTRKESKEIFFVCKSFRTSPSP